MKKWAWPFSLFQAKRHSLCKALIYIWQPCSGYCGFFVHLDKAKIIWFLIKLHHGRWNWRWKYCLEHCLVFNFAHCGFPSGWFLCRMVYSYFAIYRLHWRFDGKFNFSNANRDLEIGPSVKNDLIRHQKLHNTISDLFYDLICFDKIWQIQL